MDTKVYNLVRELKDELNNNPKVIELERLEKELNDSFEVYTLSNKKDEALEHYISNKDLYGEDDSKTLESLKELKEAKERLNTHPLVVSYLKVYSEVRDLYNEIDDIIIKPYKRK